MKKSKKIDFVWEFNYISLEKTINRRLKKGYKLYGNIRKFKRIIPGCTDGYCAMGIGHSVYGVYMLDSSVVVIPDSQSHSQSLSDSQADSESKSHATDEKQNLI